MRNRGWRALFSSNVLLPCRHLLHLPVITNTSTRCNQHLLSVARRCNQLWATLQSASKPSLLPTLATPVKLTARLTSGSSSIWCPLHLYSPLLGQSKIVVQKSKTFSETICRNKAKEYRTVRSIISSLFKEVLILTLSIFVAL